MPHLTPRIASDWQLLYRPIVTGVYVNDHTLFKDRDGQWNLIGITRHAADADPEHERHFTHGSGPTLISDNGLTERQKVIDFGHRAWAPCIVQHDGLYFLYYSPSPLKMAVTHDLRHWMGERTHIHNAPFMSCHRDPMVIRHGDRWLMYLTGVSRGYGVISVLESDNLVDWTFLRFALTTAGNAPFNPPWGATESPYVVELDGLFYLFITYVDAAPADSQLAVEAYHHTLVFCSSDPTDFGQYNGDNEDDVVVAKLFAHAPEVVQDDDGQWYITTCGWRNRGTPVEGGVAIAKLAWD